jgi:hypothetical protein
MEASLEDIKFISNYADDILGYSDPTFRMGSGVFYREAYIAAHANGLVVIGGEGAVRITFFDF